MKRRNRLSALLLALLCCWLPLSAHAEEEIIPPAWEVPDYVTWLLEIAGNEVGYREGAHGYSKYGAWAGDPYAQWCAEYLCWCVEQVDQQHGTELLKNVYPLYSGSNTGRSWFIKQGRYVVPEWASDRLGLSMAEGDGHVPEDRGIIFLNPGIGCSSHGRRRRTRITWRWWNTAHGTRMET